MTRFEVTSYPTPRERREFDTITEAKAFAETLASAELITWNVGPNLPGALPAKVYTSCALDNWNGSAWTSIDIF